MGLILTSILVPVLIALAIKQILKIRCGFTPTEENSGRTPYVILVLSAVLLCNLILRDRATYTIPLYLAASLISLYSLASSVIPQKWALRISVASISFQIASVLLTVLNAFLFHVDFPDRIFLYLTSALLSLTGVMFIVCVYFHLTDMSRIMRGGSVWSLVCLYVDAVYIIFLLLSAVLIPVLNVTVGSLFLFSLVIALSIRIGNSSVFILLTNLERRIVESMRLAQTEYSFESPGADTLYDNIYERLLRYFEIHKPYLDSELTINDIVEVVFTNKLYISKAISHCTGRNFCQFVNYYRITYAVELFRSDPQLKVLELSSRCGFNSTTSFSAAFRLYMGEKPGDWCRKERARLIRK